MLCGMRYGAAINRGKLILRRIGGVIFIKKEGKKRKTFVCFA